MIVKGKQTEFLGLSTDDKPRTNIVEGSGLFLIDTGDSWKYDATNVGWIKQDFDGTVVTEYWLDYVLNGGTVASANPETYTNITADFTLTNPTKDDNDFLGWSGGGLEAVTETVTIATGATGTREYVANWDEIFDLTYNLDGGTATNPATYTATTAEFTLSNPTKDYYTFTEWDSDSLDEPTDTVVIALGSVGDREFTASYSPIDYDITYSLDGGTAGEGNPDTYNVETAEITLAVPTKELFTFLGWTGTDLAEATLSVVIPLGSHGDRSYTATWSED